MWRLYSIALGSIVQPPYLGYCKLFQVTVIRSCGLVLFIKTHMPISSLIQQRQEGKDFSVTPLTVSFFEQNDFLLRVKVGGTPRFR